MAQRMTEAEKMEAIEKFVAENQNGFYILKSAAKAFPYCSEDTFRKWVKTFYGESLSDFFEHRGVFAKTPEGYAILANKVFGMLKEAYSEKEPAAKPDKLKEDNPDIPVEDFSWMILAHSNELDFDVSRFFTEGILRDPFTTPESVKNLAEKTLRFKEKHLFFSYKSMKRFIARETSGFKDSYFWTLGTNWVNYVFNKYPEVLGMNEREYYIKNKLLLSEENAKKEVDKCIQKLAEKYYRKKPADGTYSIDFNAKKYSIATIIDYLTEQATENGLNERDAVHAAYQVFIDAGILEGEKSENAKAFVPKSKVIKPASELENIYDDIDKYDANKLALKAGIGPDGITNFPHDRKVTVNLNGKEFYVDFKLNKTIRRIDMVGGFDGKEALLTMISLEEAREEIWKEDPNGRTDAVEYAKAHFREDIKCDKALAERRLLFLKAIGAMLFKQEIADAIVDFVPKKKNGTFYKGRVVRIASSMVAKMPNAIYEIIGRTESDDTISVAFERAIVSPENFEKSQYDFISNNWNFFKD